MYYVFLNGDEKFSTNALPEAIEYAENLSGDVYIENGRGKIVWDNGKSKH